MKPEVMVKTVHNLLILSCASSLFLTNLKDQMYIMQLLQATDDFAVVETTENDENFIDQSEVLQENFQLKREIQKLQEVSDGLKWDLNKVKLLMTCLRS